MKRLPILMALILIFEFRVFAQFTSITPLAPLPVTTDSDGKPQSKVWTYDGRQWTIFPNANGMFVWRLDGTTWTSVYKISASSVGRADCKAVGNVTHVFLYKGSSASQFVSLEYDASLKVYKLWTARPKIVGLSLETGIETGTIDIDGTGRLWLASDGNSGIYVRYSDSPYSTWSAPIALSTSVDPDDICGLIYMPGIQKIGIMWSNEHEQRFGFKTHTDGAPATTWSEDEIPASQSAVNMGGGLADDHMNLALASDGTLFCAVKTSFNKSTFPEIGLLIRRPTGKWDNLYVVDHKGTRPIVILNETIGKLKIIYAFQDGGGDIVYKESPISTISLSPQYPLITGKYNNPTTMKTNYASEIVVLASDSATVVGVLANDAPLVGLKNSSVNNFNPISNSKLKTELVADEIKPPAKINSPSNQGNSATRIGTFFRKIITTYHDSSASDTISAYIRRAKRKPV